MSQKKKRDTGEIAPLIRVPLDTGKLSTFLENMILIRRFEQRAKELFQEGKLKGTAHPCIGQEAVAVGACAALEPSDYIVSHHRGHGHCLARGASIDRMMAELLGRDSGYCRGLGGSMHIAAPELNILGANGIVGAGMGQRWPPWFRIRPLTTWMRPSLEWPRRTRPYPITITWKA